MTEEMKMATDVIKYVQESEHGAKWMFVESHEDSEEVVITFKRKPSHEMEEK